MFPRTLTSTLEIWAKQEQRKPLILRGARQVGKTTIIKEFGRQFDIFIYLNLEILEDRKLFEQNLRAQALTQLILFQKNITRIAKQRLLIFIDEIQCSPAAVSILRYFYEECPDIHVIAAGSLLETVIDHHISFPIGRVDYIYLYPLTFEEFLMASQENQALSILQEKNIPEYAHEKLLELFHLYTMIGGMPEIVSSFAHHRDWVKLGTIYENLLIGYQDDVEKYAKNNNQAKIIQHVIAAAPLHAGSRIKFQHFGQSSYGSREVGEALHLLEKALLINLVYPTTALAPPFEANHKKSPRLQFLDTGIVNFAVGLQKEFFALKDLNNLYQGKIIEHIVGQQLLGSRKNFFNQLLFWVREKAQSSSEIDYVIPKGTQLIPVEVKAGKTGALRSLHSFIDLSENNLFAIRLYSGKISREKISSPNGKKFELLNLPYYLSGQLERFIF
ncbi:MAG: ATP-binding protein [Gammaproteobacteria bacterium]|nr:ATP-binding protein [Gammaproteobacteria bacterium]